MTTSPGAQPQKIVHDNLRLVDAVAKDRFEMYQDDHQTGESTFIGFIGYQRSEEDPNAYLLQHTIVDEAFGRQGYARALATLVLEELKRREQKFSNQCSYIEDYLRRYPEYTELFIDPNADH